MSRETLEHLNTNTLIGYTDKRGTAWHYREDKQGAESNHYAGPIPVEDVRRRLFDWQGLEAEITATALSSDGVIRVTDPTRKGIVRSDTGALLGVFKKGYRVHQYDEWLVQNVESLLDADLAIGSAGLLKGGAVAWVQIEMEDTLNVHGVEFRPFLTAATSMDGSLATTYQAGAQVVVCDNTLSAAVRESGAQRIKIRHSVNSLSRIADVREALGIVYAVADEFTEQVNALIEEQVSEDRWRDFVKAYTDVENAEKGRGLTMAEAKAGELNRLWRHDDRVAPWSGTAYGVLAAVNTYVHHIGTVKNVTRAERNAERAVMGQVDALDRSTLALLATV